MPRGQHPAYPTTVHINTPDGLIYEGLSQRDLFAAMAMQGLCAAKDTDACPDSWLVGISLETAKKRAVCDAQLAVIRADALLKELEQ